MEGSAGEMMMGEEECIVDWSMRHYVGETPGLGRKRRVAAVDSEAIRRVTGHFQVWSSSQMDSHKITLYLDFQLHPPMPGKIGRKRASEPRMSMQLALLPRQQQQTCGDLPQ